MNPHPAEFYPSAGGLGGAGLADSGFSRFGGFLAFTYEEAAYGYLLEFEVFHVDRPLADLAVFFFLDGVYHARVPAATGFFFFLPPANQPECDLEAFVLPNQADFETLPLNPPAWPNRLALDWTYTREIASARVRIQPGVSVTTTTPTKVFSYPVPTVTTAAAASGGTLAASGNFNGVEKSGTIDVTVSTPGHPGGALVLAWTFDANSGSVTPSDSKTHLVDGVFVTLESGFEYQTGDVWEITLDFPRTYTSAPLAPGTYAAVADTYNRRGAKTTSNTTNTTLTGPPSPPTLTLTAYNGGGEAELTYTIPAEATIESAVFYLNFHPLAVAEFPATGDGSAQLFTLPGLRFPDYQNRVLCRLKSAAGLESQNLDWSLVAVDDLDTLAAAAPNAPYDLRAVEIAGSLVTVTVDADATSDAVEIYVDNQDLVVDYSAAIKTLTNPATAAFNTFSGNIDWTTLGAGTWRLAARALKAGYAETNTTILADITVDLAAAPAATLTAEAVR